MIFLSSCMLLTVIRDMSFWTPSTSVRIWRITNCEIVKGSVLDLGSDPFDDPTTPNAI